MGEIRNGCPQGKETCQRVMAGLAAVVERLDLLKIL